MIETADITTPVGEVRLALRDGKLCALTFVDNWAASAASLARRFPVEEVAPGPAARAIALRVLRWLDGDFSALDGVELDVGGTPFQQRVWAALRDIPPGATTSYAEIARIIGVPRAARAVGAANRANPVWLVVPCHRVVRATGEIGGYGGGVDRKRWLLDLERNVVARA